MVMQLGGVRKAPKPSSSTLEEALKLFSFMGGDNKAGKKLLEEMKDVAAHNEKILAEANAAVQEANKMNRDLDDARQAFSDYEKKTRTEFENVAAELVARSKGLDEKKSNDDAYFKSQKESLDAKSKDVYETDQSLAAREKALVDRFNELEAREKKVKAAEAHNTKVLRDLELRDQRVRQAMGG